MKYKFIWEHLNEFPVSRMCSALEIAQSGYYKWCRQAQGHTPSPRKEADKVLTEQIESVFIGSRKLYGSPRVQAVLKADGVSCSRKRVARLMKAKNLTPKLKKHKTRTTDSQHNDPVAPNKLNREFEAEALTTNGLATSPGSGRVKVGCTWLFYSIFIRG